MKMHFDYNKEFFRGFKNSGDQCIVAYDFSISRKKIDMKSLFDHSFFGDSCTSSYCAYNNIPTPEQYKDVSNSAGDLARDMIRGFCP
jgi:hypothetical protein